ncbi:MAG: class I SAM-dependent methyltransferase [Vicinamibacterales bacterium]
MATPVNYDDVAQGFERRYAAFDYSGFTHALLDFVARSTGDASPLVLDAGCGTGHWLRTLRDQTPSRIVGVDRSGGMLAVARAAAATDPLAQADAAALPFLPHTFDAVFCLNAVHHFADPSAFVREAGRVVTPGGGLMVAGLDPQAGVDRWWLYDTFPGAHDADLRRYPAMARVRDWMSEAGFEDIGTSVVQTWRGRVSIPDAFARGLLDRTGTSQLMVLSDTEYEAGVDQLKAAAERGSSVRLETDLRLFATVGWKAPTSRRP